MNPDSIISDIKSLKIQGAENIAKTSIELVYTFANSNKLPEIKKIIEKLKVSRPTEPCLRNSLKYLTFNSTSVEQLIDRCERAKKHFNDADEQIATIGERKIQNGSTILTHCHSSTVIKILSYAKSKGKRFNVICTETRPLFQGRRTAQDLLKLKIPTTMVVDSAVFSIIKQCNLCFIGADAITTEGTLINKIGSKMIALTCKEQKVPIYSCTNSWKFDPETVYGFDEKIENRSTKEIWDKPPKGLKLMNPAFDSVESDLITSVISEIGIYKLDIFVEELRLHYPWMLEK